MSGRLGRASAAVLAAVLLAGCGGGGDDEEESVVGGGLTTTTAPVGAAGEPDAGTGDGNGDAPAAGSRAGSGGSRVGTSGGAGAAATTARVGAAPGIYRYARKGTSEASGGYSASKPVDIAYSATVEAPRGQEQRTVFEGGSPEKETLLRFSDNGAELVFVRIQHGNKQREFRPAPPPGWAPRPATPGRAWTWTMTSADGEATISGEGKVVRGERIRAGGESVDTTVYEFVLRTTTPDFTRTDRRTVWWSDRHQMMVKQHDVVDVDQAGFHIHTDATTTIDSLKPE